MPATHYDNLAELIGYLYGKNSVIKSQGTDRPRLQRVLGSEDGLRELRATGDLAAAEAVAGLRDQDWLSLLAKAASILTKVNGDAAIVVESLELDDANQAKLFLRRIETQIRQIRSAFQEADQ